MDLNARQMIPHIPSADYDKVAAEFLESFYPEALQNPMRVPIEDIARNGLGLDIQYLNLTEELDVYGMTIFTDGIVEIYDSKERLYDEKPFKAKTILIDSEAVKKTNIGCRNNTLAHECVHWYKHRYYYKMQSIQLPRYARYCKCHVDQLPYTTDDENLLESQAVGIAPRILMPEKPFIEAAEHLGISYGKDNYEAIWTLAEFFDVSKRTVKIRLEECKVV